ncbi:MAG: hypothetical protein Q7J01_00700 [Syntrophales bacterium]|nr:hypothetical protein [Syntrophales bacterium]
MKKIIILMIVVLFSAIISSCAFYTSTPITTGVNEGKLQIGMTPQEVRNVIGNPDKVAKRLVSENDIREVWMFKEYSLDPTGACLSFGLGPSLPEKQYLIFQNDRLVGWNLPDPFSPDLIIEKRER